MKQEGQIPQLDEQGREVPDPQPIAIPAGFREPETLEQRIRRLVRSEQFSASMDSQGFETFEESEDFEIDDDMFDPESPYEEVFDPVLGRGITMDEFHKNEAVYRERFLKADQEAYKAMEVSDALRARRKKDESRSDSPTPPPAPKKEP